MAENKKSFVLYSDLISIVKKIVLKDRADGTNYGGELFLHILEYVNDQEPIPIDFIVEMAFEPIKLQLKRDLEKYEVTKQKRSLAGKKSAEVKQQNSTNPTSVESVQQTSTNPTVNDTVNVNENVNDNDILLEKETKGENQYFIQSDIPEEKEIPESVNPETEETKKVAQKKVVKFSKKDFYEMLIQLGAEEKDALDWMEVRKQRRAVFTENAINLVVEECEKHDFLFSEAIKACAKYGWQGFKHEWYINQITPKIQSNNFKTKSNANGIRQSIER